MDYAKPIKIPARKRHTSTVIVIHGLGDSGDGWVDFVQGLRREGQFEEVTFLLPHAPLVPLTLHNGALVPAWHDIVSLNNLEEGQEEEDRILASRDFIHKLVDREVENGIPANRIVIGGFSQGGAMSLLSGVTYKSQLGGIFGLSCYPLLHKKRKELVPADDPNQKTPIFQCHGDADDVVRYQWGQRCADELTKHGHNVDFRTFKGMGHTLCPKEITELKSYLIQQIPPLGDAKLKTSV